MRWHPPGSSLGSSLASRGNPEQAILEVLDPDERAQWATLPAADRAKLVREFRGGPITPNGRSYLKKRIALQSPAPADRPAASSVAK
jgi:hypothetical protein